MSIDDLGVYCDWLEDQGIDAAVMRNLLFLTLHYDFGLFYNTIFKNGHGKGQFTYNHGATKYGLGSGFIRGGDGTYHYMT